MRMKCALPLFSLFISWPHFVFFCCKLVSVNDPAASLADPTVDGPTLGSCVLVQCVFFFFLFMTPVDVFFAPGVVEEALD